MRIGHNKPVSDPLLKQIDQLADLMERHKLSRASLTLADSAISFRKLPRIAPKPTPELSGPEEILVESAPHATPIAPAAPTGMPVTSPMNGIYYGAPSPTSSPFVREGDTVQAGEVIALIEAMKVFNEVMAPMSGTILRIAAESGSVVSPGDPLLYIG